ncbi:MAG TPA: ABC transporter substrate-binding protein [Candidatus Binatia bacterium]|nr:ABC transporter substrate-binding protein [Candidatus Binatia bacterium]
MSRKLHLTLAAGDYEIVRALKEGTVKPDGIELTVLTDMTSDVRHWRMLRNREFDVAELSMSNYLMAKYTGLPFTAIPVFLHRRFRHGFVFVNASKSIKKPSDLIGRNVGLRNFQATANLWIRGILEHEHGVPHRSVNWFKQDEEEVDWAPPRDLKIQRIAAGKSVEKMLLDGELDALIHPEIIQPILDKDPRVTRLFPNYRDLEIDYYRRTGIFPIMHTTAIKQEIVEKYPWVPINLMRAFEASKQVAYKRMENPRIVPLAWFRHFLEEQEELLGRDPWVYGLGEDNRRALETLMQYSQEQGLIGKKMSLEELFVNTEAHS